MEQAVTRQETAEGSMNFSKAVWALREAVHRRLIDKGVGRFCNVFVHQNGKLLELSGTVDSEWIHAEILSMVPDEERCISDNIKVIPRCVPAW